MHAWIRVSWRFFYFVVSTLIHMAGFLLVIATGSSKETAGARLRRRWLSHVPKRMGMDLRMEGQPYQGPCLYIANHISYIDPFAVLLHVEANVVAKAEVLRWPLVGLAGYLAGTIFVNRENKSSRLQTAETIRRALESGKSILIFPEGTTSAGPGTLPFRPRAFEEAQAANVPVQPIAIMYDHPAAAFIGDHLFLPHFFRLFRLERIKGRITFGPLLYGENACAQAYQWINKTQMPHLKTILA